MARKFIHCFNCNDIKWADHVVGFNYQCVECDSDIDLRKSKIYEKKQRDKLKLEKGKVYIKGVTDKVKPQKKSKRVEDKAYLQFIREQRCLVSNYECQTYAIHAHHHERVSQLGSDHSAIPLCAFHHMKLHTSGVDSFATKYKIDYDAQIKRLNLLYKIKTGLDLSKK